MRVEVANKSSMSKPKKMKGSEPIVWDYLREWCPGVRYEAKVGTSNPDFSIADEGGDCTAFWDVADREFTAADRRELESSYEASQRGEREWKSGRTKDMDFIQSKLHDKYRQFKNCGPVPGMLVLAEWAGAVWLNGDYVSIVLEGWPAMRVTLGGEFEPEFCRGDDGRTNSPIAAVGIVRQKNTAYYKFGIHDFHKRTMDRFGNDEHTYGLWMKEEARLRSCGVDLDSKTTYLEIYRNGNARSPWPTELRGPFDQVFDIVSGCLEPILIHNGLAPDVTIPIPMSEAQMDIDAIMASPGFRND